MKLAIKITSIVSLVFWTFVLFSLLATTGSVPVDGITLMAVFMSIGVLLHNILVLVYVFVDEEN